jgi:hypothetical protein
MKKSQHTSKGLAQATMYETAQLINVSYKTDIAKFEAFDPELNMDLSDKLTTTLTEISDLDPDFMLEALQMEATKKVVDISSTALVNIRNARYYIEKAFPGDTLKFNYFGLPDLAKARKSQLRFALFLKSFAKACVKYKAELTAKGMPIALIEDIIKQGQDLDDANLAQEQAKKERYAATGLRIKAYDKLWEIAGSIAKAGKLIFANEPDKLRDYVLDRSPKKKTVKVAEKEVETAVLQGTIIDADTKEAIEDAIIQISGTNLKTTTDEDGEFYIDTVLPATYTINIIAFGYKEYQQTNLVLNSGNEEQEFSFEMEKQD